MRLEPLYRLTFHYPEWWHVDAGAGDEHYLFVAEGRCEGGIAGRFRGANHPRRRGDGTYLPDFQGVIETDDGATIMVETRGFGRAYPEPRRQVVVATTHFTGDERYRRLNDVLCVGVGEVRPQDERTDIVIDVAEVVWEPLPDTINA